MDSIKKSSVIKFLLVIYSFVMAFVYVDKMWDWLYDKTIGAAIGMVVATAGFVIWNELTMLFQRMENNFEVDKKSVREARFWEVILMLVSVATHFGAENEFNFFIMHVVVVYMVLCGTGHLFKGESSIYVFGDLVNGFFRIPFPNFIARSRTVIEFIKEMMLPSEENDDAENGNKKAKKFIAAILSLMFIVVAVAIFFMVFNLLADIDSSFKNASIGISKFFDELFDDFNLGEKIGIVLISIPVGSYLSGLFFGCTRWNNSYEKRVSGFIDGNYKKLKIIPAVIFYIVSAMYIIMYLLFFVSQARLLFSGFAGVLPEEFTASQYARDGFSQLSSVLVINFLGLGIMRLFSSRSVVESKLTAAGSITLMATSMVFAVISASKIILYISRFGYTDLRAESLWFTVVAFAGAALAIVNIVKDIKTFKPWMIFSASSFILMNIIAGICQIK